MYIDDFVSNNITQHIHVENLKCNTHTNSRYYCIYFPIGMLISIIFFEYTYNMVSIMRNSLNSTIYFSLLNISINDVDSVYT